MKVAKVKNHYTPEEFKKLFTEFRNDGIVYNRLVFIRSLLNGNTIKDTARILDIDRRTGSEWLKRFNENGVEGLIPHYNERGKKCKLSDEQLKKLKEEITKEGSSYTIKKARKYILDEFGISYSYKQVWEITTKKLELKYKKHPENYKGELKK